MLIPYTRNELSITALFTTLYETRVSTTTNNELNTATIRNSHCQYEEIYTYITNDKKEDYIHLLNEHISLLTQWALVNPHDSQRYLSLINVLNHYIIEITDRKTLVEQFWDFRILSVKPFDNSDYFKPNVLKKNIINEKEVERRAIAQAAAVKTNTITEEDIKNQSEDDIDTTFDMDDEDDFDFSIKPEPTDVNNNATNQKREFKPWVIPLFASAGLVLFGSLLYGYFN